MPFAINLVANILFMPIFAGLRNVPSAAADILIVWTTIIWLAATIWPVYKWVAIGDRSAIVDYLDVPLNKRRTDMILKGLAIFAVVVALAGHMTIQAQEKKDQPKSFTNSIDMKFVWIPPGTFVMGSPKEEKEREANETQHKVTLTKGFYMGVYVVTQEQWQAVMGNNPSVFKGEKNLPVETISWDDCQQFLKKLREKDKKPYRLPSEAEWEYACRAGTKTPFHFGETISTDQANYQGNFNYGNGKKGVNRQKTTPVDSFPANPWGLHDMHGNVFQWCQDSFGDYPQKDVVDPQELNAGPKRVQRGGSWGLAPGHLRSACRSWSERGDRGDGFGFRICFFVE